MTIPQRQKASMNPAGEQRRPHFPLQQGQGTLFLGWGPRL